MQLNKTYISKLLLGFTIVAFAGCRADGNYPGVEYAPQMYHSVAYEPLSQITSEGIASGVIERNYYVPNSLPYNDYKGAQPMNMRKPVAGTVARQHYASLSQPGSPNTDQVLLHYELHKDSIDLAARLLKNPLPQEEKVVDEGKHLYLSFCAPCHGENGDGKGKVGEVYKGVPNYSTGRYATLTEGHIFHTITHGKGRMWSHKGQINSEDRWKIVMYVQKLQKGTK